MKKTGKGVSRNTAVATSSYNCSPFMCVLFMRVFPHRPIPMFVLQRFILVSEYKSHFTETFKDKTIGWTWIKFWIGKESQILRCGFCEFEKSLCHVSFWQTLVQTQIPWIHYEIIRQEGRVGCLLIGRSVNCIPHVEDPWARCWTPNCPHAFSGLWAICKTCFKA